jgi:hypothetical protein
VVFTRYDQRTGQGSLYVKSGATGSATKLPVTGNASAPTVSPDGRYLAFARNGQLILSNADGTDQWNVAPAYSGVARPVWSPDGKRIAFVIARQVMVADVATGAVHVVATYPAGDTVFRPAWRDDAWRLVYTVSRATPYGDAINLYEASWDRVVAPHALTTNDSFGWHDLDPWPAGGTGPVPDLTAPGGSDVTRSLTATSATLTMPGGPDTARRVVRIATGATPPATMTSDRAAYDGLRSKVKLTVSPGTQYSVSVWLVDWAGNVGPRVTRTFTTPHVTSVSVAVSPSLVTYDSPVTVSGTARDVTTGAPLAGHQVVLEGTKPYSSPDTRTVTTDAQGHYAVTFRPLYGTKVWATAVADAVHEQAKASTWLAVRDYVKATLADATIRAGSTATVHAVAKPDQADELQAYIGGAWRPVASFTFTSTLNRYVARWPDVPRGTWRLRVHAIGGSFVRAAYSPVVTLTAS